MRAWGTAGWCRSAALLLLLGTLAASADTVYRSIGADGRVVYSDHPPTSGRVEKTYTFENLPASPVPESVLRYRSDLEKRTARRLAAPTGVRLYSAAWCGYCAKAKAFLNSKGIDYQEVDIDTEDGKLAFLQEGGKGGIPLLLLNGRQLRGFTEAAYDSFLRQGR